MKKRLATAAAAFLVLGSAQAQMAPMTTSALYGELGYTFLKMDAFGTSFRPAAIRGILGWDVHPTFAVEGMLAGGVVDDDKGISINGSSGQRHSEDEQHVRYLGQAKVRVRQNRVFRPLRVGPHRCGSQPSGLRLRVRGSRTILPGAWA